MEVYLEAPILRLRHMSLCLPLHSEVESRPGEVSSLHILEAAQLRVATQLREATWFKH